MTAFNKESEIKSKVTIMETQRSFDIINHISFFDSLILFINTHQCVEVKKKKKVYSERRRVS